MVPELKLEGVRFRAYRGDQLRVRGDAVTAAYRRDSGGLVASDLSAVLPRGGSVPARVTAPVGQGDLREKTFSLSGGVTLTRGDDLARTERARYEPGPDGRGLVRGDDPITVRGPAYRLDGTGFTLDPDQGELAIGGHPRLVAGVREAR